MHEHTAAQRSNRVPVSVIAGFLGAGKTTLLNRLIRHPDMSDAAVIVNEFGEIGIDHVLVDSALDNAVVMDSGCLCCTIRGDLIDTVRELFAKAEEGAIPRFSKILIEPTGLADPAPIANAVDQMEAMGDPCELAAIVTLIDAQQGVRQLDTYDEAARQVAVADAVLVTKADLGDGGALHDLAGRIDTLNPGVPVRSIVHGNIDPADLFALAAHTTVPAPRTAAAHQNRSHDHVHDRDYAGHGDESRHGEIAACAVSTDRILQWDRLRTFLETLYSLRGEALLRVKGIVWLDGDSGPTLIQSVGNAFSRPRRLHDEIDDPGRSRLVFIHKGLDSRAIERSFHAMVFGEVADR
jgi:G3E family GTPase